MLISLALTHSLSLSAASVFVYQKRNFFSFFLLFFKKKRKKIEGGMESNGGWGRWWGRMKIVGQEKLEQKKIFVWELKALFAISLTVCCLENDSIMRIKSSQGMAVSSRTLCCDYCYYIHCLVSYALLFKGETSASLCVYLLQLAKINNFKGSCGGEAFSMEFVHRKCWSGFF